MVLYNIITSMEATTPKIIFIVPYRDRVQHKSLFERNMEHIMEDYDKKDYEIYFSEQRDDDRQFNRGATKNIGFLAMKNLYPDHYKNITFVFNDVDCFPCMKNILDYETQHGKIKHFYGFKYVLGGIFSIKGADFEKLNGFPNFWTWGYEDNMIYNKALLDKSITVDRSVFFPIFDMNICHMADVQKRLINVRQSGMSKDEHFKNNIHSLRDVNYKIEGNMIKILRFNVSLPYQEKIQQIEVKLGETDIKGIKKKYQRFNNRMPMRVGKR